MSVRHLVLAEQLVNAKLIRTVIEFITAYAKLFVGRGQIIIGLFSIRSVKEIIGNNRKGIVQCDLVRAALVGQVDQPPPISAFVDLLAFDLFIELREKALFTHWTIRHIDVG